MRRFPNVCTIILFWLLFGATVKAQENVVPVLPLLNRTEQNNPPDAVRTIRPEEINLDSIGDIRSQLNKLNDTYSTPENPDEDLLRFLKEDKLEMSEEVKYWINFARDSSTFFRSDMTFRDTVIVSPLYLTPVFYGGKVDPDILFYDSGLNQPQDPFKRMLPKPETLTGYAKQKDFEKRTLRYLETNHPAIFRYSRRNMPNQTIVPEVIRKDIAKEAPVIVQQDRKSVEDVDAPIRFIPERLYWRSAFESSVHFSQNYFSPNWHQGGVSNLNLLTRNYLKYDYQKDKVQLTNEMEIKVSTYTAPKDTLRAYKIAEDLFRIRSNLGIKAFNRWYYSFNAEFRTQLFSNFQENSDKRMAALLSPFSVNLGLGMKYDLSKAFKQKYKNLTLSLNLDPLSYTYMYSMRKDPSQIDLGRHGFQRDEETGEFKNRLSRFGSSFRANLTFNFNKNVSWTSRVYYFTSYDRVTGEFENRLNMAISRFFSTSIYLYLRYDDGVTKKEDFDSYFQINELLSFGFNYKW
jgi:hypothetical protein